MNGQEGASVSNKLSKHYQIMPELKELPKIGDVVRHNGINYYITGHMKEASLSRRLASARRWKGKLDYLLSFDNKANLREVSRHPFQSA